MSSEHYPVEKWSMTGHSVFLPCGSRVTQLVVEHFQDFPFCFDSIVYADITDAAGKRMFTPVMRLRAGRIAASNYSGQRITALLEYGAE